jgi:glycosyltransferase involved in cell wall biosynthesis
LEKKYRAIYVGRRIALKRHMLAAKVNGLALVAGINHSRPVSEIPKHVFLNDRQLTPEEVCVKINESHCGLILSDAEGGCFASSEYLLCGIPVVSTQSFGGRDVWYDNYNSIICDSTPEAVAEAVDHFVTNSPDPYAIRSNHIALANKFRANFVRILGSILIDHGIKNIDPKSYFKDNFYHKMRKSYQPDFEQIFGN